jgi:hypothetical protein
VVQVVESGGVAGELGLAAVPEPVQGAGHELGNSRIVNNDALDGARGGDGLDTRLLALGVEELGKLVDIPCLGASGAIETPGATRKMCLAHPTEWLRCRA